MVVIVAARAAEPMIITSATKQFIVRGLPQRSLLSHSPNSETVYLDPALLAVTCETVKRTLQRELGWGDRWQGAVYINIHPIRSDDDFIRVTARRADGRWRYHVDVPDEVQRRNLIETLVELLIVEFADRGAAEQSVELPPWLVMGLTAHLTQGPLAGVALQARTLNEIRDEPALRVARTTRYADADKMLRETVQQHGALTFDQLNWPDFDPNDAQAESAYRRSAHLFVRELLRLRGGTDCLCAMLAMLPQHLNWQTAFCRGFEPYFHRMLDVEKWWSLNLMQWKTHDNVLTWSSAEAKQKLEETLRVPVQIQSRDGAMARVAPMSLQTIINDWSFQEQLPVLQAKVGQLQTARFRLPGEVVRLADSYRLTIEKYLQARNGAWFEMTARAATARAVAELNALDAERERLTNAVLAGKQAGRFP
jgi:hypothetical protein